MWLQSLIYIENRATGQTVFDGKSMVFMKTIKDLPEHSRPREKLREKGASGLSDEELVSAILGMGTAGVDVRTIGPASSCAYT